MNKRQLGPGRDFVASRSFATGATAGLASPALIRPDTLKGVALMNLHHGGGRWRWVQGDCRNSVGRTPSRWRAARYWVLIVSLTFIGLEILAKATAGVLSSSARTVMVP